MTMSIHRPESAFIIDDNPRDNHADNNTFGTHRKVDPHGADNPILLVSDENHENVGKSDVGMPNVGNEKQATDQPKKPTDTHAQATLPYNASLVVKNEVTSIAGEGDKVPSGEIDDKPDVQNTNTDASENKHADYSKETDSDQLKTGVVNETEPSHVEDNE